ncbi:tetraacyldisaccharide 4'-kinase [Geobacter sp. OR-1]|uniref:tetraacyldisaccharide 4'-kinase n=1 Tax=Geobacter sp. OR-1 TaxID=1266765 RepID=UPI0005436E34|nr:tetraacyldisaccharide 4'-kinase [Geobacter sp. OR-1]GAM07932.1 tetraacyldisaccharide 4'-kinase [Geobacter sp. OR-1]
MSREQYFRELLAGKRQGAGDRLLLALLRLAAVPYSAIMRLRALGYRSGLLRSRRLARPVISVGNITVGGTGKTPTVLFLARMLMARGKRVAVLTRGYGGSLEGETRVVSDGSALLLSAEEAGDEPCLLASSLAGLIVVMGPDRYRAGNLAMERFSPDLFILDDGFQHQRLKRDLDILLLDAKDPFAGSRTFPAGLLREPVTAAQRADLVLFTRCGELLPEIPAAVRAIPYCSASHALTGWAPLAGGDSTSFAELSGRRVLAFAGIADPSGFFDALEREGVPLLATLAFPDHTRYGKEELEALGRLKTTKKADCLITTAKDAVKLLPYRGILGNCLVARLELKINEPGPLVSALDKLL